MKERGSLPVALNSPHLHHWYCFLPDQPCHTPPDQLHHPPPDWLHHPPPHPCFLHLHISITWLSSFTRCWCQSSLSLSWSLSFIVWGHHHCPHLIIALPCSLLTCPPSLSNHHMHLLPLTTQLLLLSRAGGQCHCSLCCFQCWWCYWIHPVSKITWKRTKWEC